MTAVSTTLPDILPQIQSILAAVLAVEADEAVPEANFFFDLQGESIDVLDLTFHCEKTFGVKAPFKELTAADPSYIDSEGRFSPKGAAVLAARCPWLDAAALTEQTPHSLFTVGFITRTLQQALIESGRMD
jgi:acyl carrier protein